MQQQRDIMGMPVVVEIVDPHVEQDSFEEVFAYLRHIDEVFSTYKPQSEISKINAGELSISEASDEMQLIFNLAKETKRATHGYFDIKTPSGLYDPSGLVKGWAIQGAVDLLHARGYKNFFVDIGGDVQVSGVSESGEAWSIGVRSPFDSKEIIKVVYPQGKGVATSGTYVRGRHVWNPHTKKSVRSPFVSLTVLGPNIYEADRIATAAFAMGRQGLLFIEQLEGFEGYAVDMRGMATATSGFAHYTHI